MHQALRDRREAPARRTGSRDWRRPRGRFIHFDGDMRVALGEELRESSKPGADLENPGHVIRR